MRVGRKACNLLYQSVYLILSIFFFYRFFLLGSSKDVWPRGGGLNKYRSTRHLLIKQKRENCNALASRILAFNVPGGRLILYVNHPFHFNGIAAANYNLRNESKANVYFVRSSHRTKARSLNILQDEAKLT